MRGSSKCLGSARSPWGNLGGKPPGAGTSPTPQLMRVVGEVSFVIHSFKHALTPQNRVQASFCITMAGDDNDASTSSTGAKRRLEQITSHIEPNTHKKRRRRRPESDLPADYSDVLGQIASLRSIAATPDPNNRGYVRQKQAGKLWVRERVEQLLDPGSFQEVGSVSGTVTWKQLSSTKEEPSSYVPSNNVQGLGRLKGRKIVFTADDFSIRAGHADGALMDKTVR